MALFGFTGTILILGLGYFLRSWLDKEIDQKITKVVKNNYPSSVQFFNSSGDNFIGGSFSDTFSGSGWLGESVFYQDRYTAGLTPLPIFELRPLKTEPTLPDKASICPQSVCFSVVNKKIFEAGIEKKLPEFSGDLINLSVFLLEDRWFLGLISKESQLFKGWVYSFNGSDFVPFFSADKNNPIFESKYEGFLGLAGSKSNWLLVYGSYEGKVFEFYDNKLLDLSYLVNPRVMRGGFMPRVMSIGKDWFVSNSSGGFPLLKFFSAGGSIIGSLDLTDLIDEKFSEDLRWINAEQYGEKLFLELRGLSANSAWFEFLDGEFAYPENTRITSKNIRLNQPQIMGRAKFLSVDVYPAAAQPRLFLANSGENFIEAKLGEWVYFPRVGEELYWRLDFSEVKKPFFLDLIRLEYGLVP